MSTPPPTRTRTFCASGAATRNITRLSGRMHGYGAPGMFSTLGLQSAGGCSQAFVPPTHRPTPATSAAKILAFTGCSLRIQKSTEPGQTRGHHRDPEHSRLQSALCAGHPRWRHRPRRDTDSQLSWNRFHRQDHPVDARNESAGLSTSEQRRSSWSFRIAVQNGDTRMLDLGVTKVSRSVDRVRLKLMMDLFNVFNTSNIPYASCERQREPGQRHRAGLDHPARYCDSG